jgi:dienelactone hydrolase
VVVIQDWDGMNDYEKERSRMLASMGYIGFAADIYGVDTPVATMMDWINASSTHRQNSTLYMAKIHAAITKVKTLDFVDTSKIAVIGYCFGGTGIVNMALLGEDVLGVVGYHSGIAPANRVRRQNTSAPMKAKLLLHSGVKDDKATDMALLEQELEEAGAKYEIARFGSGVVHSFTAWDAKSPGQAMYDRRADVRSWHSTAFFLKELFEGMPAARTAPAASALSTSLHNYTCDNQTCQGYLAFDSSMCTAAKKCPAVVVIQDWNGMNDYEKMRSRLLTKEGYVGFAADIYGIDTPVATMMDWIRASSTHRQNSTLYMAKIHAAITKVKTLDFVDTSKIAVIGYCFGGTGIVNMALLGEDVLGVVGYHSGIAPANRVRRQNTSAPMKAKLLLHSGVKDDKATDMAELEQELEEANAKYEIIRYGSGVVHSFTDAEANTPNQAMYDIRADIRSWESTQRFLKELFVGLPASDRAYPCNATNNKTVSSGAAQALGLLGYIFAIHFF